MSVHAEFSRALEALIDRLGALDHPRRDAWVIELRDARVGSQPDLSSAAEAARAVLVAIHADENAQAVEGLLDPREHLAAHCRAILG